MSPEFGCTVTYFPIDEQTLAYLSLTGRLPEEGSAQIRAYAQANHLRRVPARESPVLPLPWWNWTCAVEPSVAGPRRSFRTAFPPTTV